MTITFSNRGQRRLRAYVLAGLGAVSVFWCQPALAEALKAGSEPLSTPSVTFSLLRVMGALAIVFAVLFGGAWLFRNWQRLAVRNGRAPKLNVLEVKSLGARHALYVVGYERQRFLLSSAPGGISMLTALPEAEETGEDPSLPAPSFADTLARALSPMGSQKPGKGL